jgi:hypothetical protein
MRFLCVEVSLNVRDHSLRTPCGRDTRTIAAVLGHVDEKMATHYSREADQRRRAKAAIAKLERTSDKNGKPLGRKWKTRTLLLP